MPRAGNKRVFNSNTYSPKAAGFYALENLFPTHTYTHTHTHRNLKKPTLTKTYTFPCCMSQNPHPTLIGFRKKINVSEVIRQFIEFREGQRAGLLPCLAHLRTGPLCSGPKHWSLLRSPEAWNPIPRTSVTAASETLMALHHSPPLANSMVSPWRLLPLFWAASLRSSWLQDPRSRAYLVARTGVGKVSSDFCLGKAGFIMGVITRKATHTVFLGVSVFACCPNISMNNTLFTLKSASAWIINYINILIIVIGFNDHTCPAFPSFLILCPSLSRSMFWMCETPSPIAEQRGAINICTQGKLTTGILQGPSLLEWEGELFYVRRKSQMKIQRNKGNCEQLAGQFSWRSRTAHGGPWIARETL